MFYLSATAAGCLTGCNSAREAFGSQKSTNLIGDDGEQLTSSCERKDREKIIRNERHLRRAMC